ncbi:MAG: OadG family protein [Clostridia bacterium]
MNGFLSSALCDTAPAMTFLEKFLLGLETAFIGIVMVFLVLFFLIGIIKLVEKFNVGGAVAKKPTPQPMLPVANLECQDDAVIAAITAAIYCLNEEVNATSEKKVKFVVRSIKEIR